MRSLQKRYADDILYALLDVAERDEIRNNRRTVEQTPGPNPEQPDKVSEVTNQVEEATLTTGARTASVIPRFRPIVYIILTSVSYCGQKNLITAKISSPLTIQISRPISTISQIL